MSTLAIPIREPTFQCHLVPVPELIFMYFNSFFKIINELEGLRWRQYRDCNGEWTPVSTNLAEGQMQLAMEETEERKDRDAKAIRSMVYNLTEESEWNNS